MCHQESCCDYGGSHHSHHHSHGHSDCCCEGTRRRFNSKVEKREGLENYKKELELELAAVKELLEEKF